MLGFKRLSIKHKLLTLVGGITLSCLVLGFALVTVRDISTFKSEMVANALVLARMTGEYTVSDLAFQDRDAAADSLSKLAEVRSLRSAVLYDAEGEVFSVYGEAPEISATAPEPPRGPPVEFLDGELRVIQPVVYQGERFGSVVVRVSTRELDEKIRRNLLVLSAVLAVLVGLALIAAYRLQRWISDPILELANTTRRISLTGDYSLRFENDREDEVGVLRDGFNEMLEQIHQREVERDEAEHKTQEKSRFLANMSHELRTPLNSIIGFSEILLRRLPERLDEREQRFLSNIRNSGKHLLEIINDILDLSKVEAGKMELHPERVRMADVVDSVVRLMKPIADQQQILIEVDLAPELPFVELDPVKTKQILYNLVSNAVKFSPELSTVRVVCGLLEPSRSPIGEKAIELAVVDQGIGIAAEDHAKIFQSFRQVDGTSSRRFGGTGLGLALVKAFAEMHGGIVELESELGQGSRFRVVLPCRETGREAGPRTRRDPRTILVVEDDPETVERLRKMFVDEGYEPVVATTGEAAVALARTVRPVAVSLDLVLPGMLDGWEVLRTMKSDPETCDIPILIFSRLENRELGLSLGADDYFLKPVDLRRMVTRLGELVADREKADHRILVADDDPSVHELLRSRLGAEGFAIDHAYSREECLDKASGTRPALVVLDLMMGHMDGFGLALELRSRPETASIPIVLLTRQDLTESDRRRLQGQALSFVGRGEAGGEQLIRVLRQLLQRQPTVT